MSGLRCQERSAPPSIALALMAAQLATQRCEGHHCTAMGQWAGVDRIDTIMRPGRYPASAEYYRIIDRIARGVRNP